LLLFQNEFRSENIMSRVRLIHWKAEEAEERLAKLRAAGYEVDYGEMQPGALQDWRKALPDAFVIDLSRMPMQGRDVAMDLRGKKITRNIPLVFVEGDPEKVERIKGNLPDATYTTWGRIRGAIKAAIANQPANPVVPASNLAGYSGTPLPKKLGIKPNSTVALVGAPKDFEKTLGELPEGVKLKKRPGKPCDLILWFIRMRAELYDRIQEMGGSMETSGASGIWIIWPKQASGLMSDLTQNVVRETGLASGLVDYKVCAVDATWSGLKFAQRKTR
jgi:CheY-like chemotaxis protein